MGKNYMWQRYYINHRERNGWLSKWCWKVGSLKEKHTLDTYLIPYAKINSNLMNNINVKESHKANRYKIYRTGPWITSFCPTLFHYNIDKKNNHFPEGPTVCVEFARFFYPRGFSPRTGLLSLSKDVRVRWTGVSKLSQPEWVCESQWPCDGRVHYPGWVPHCALSCQQRLRPSVTLNWKKQVGE